MALDPLLAGSQYVLLLEYASGDPYVPSSAPARLVLDAPNGTLRVSRQYIPGGPSDSGVVAVGNAVQYTLDTTTTAAMGAVPGPWSAYVLLGTGPTYVGPEYGRATLPVITPPGGPV